MNKEINEFISEFKTVFNGEPWYGKSLMAVVKEADTNKVFYKPNAGSHSAYEILEHIYAWRDLFVKRLNGDHLAKIEMNSREDWSENDQANTTAWFELIKKLESNQAELLRSLAAYSDEALDKPFVATKYSLRVFCNGHIQHDIYHIGQIALALKNAI